MLVFNFSFYFLFLILLLSPSHPCPLFFSPPPLKPLIFMFSDILINNIFIIKRPVQKEDTDAEISLEKPTWSRSAINWFWTFFYWPEDFSWGSSNIISWRGVLSGSQPSPPWIPLPHRGAEETRPGTGPNLRPWGGVFVRVGVSLVRQKAVGSGEGRGKAAKRRF